MNNLKKFYSRFLICFLYFCSVVCFAGCDFLKKETYYQSDSVIFCVYPKLEENDTDNKGNFTAYGKPVMDNMLMLLNSEAFAIRLKEVGNLTESANEIIESIRYSYTSANEHVRDFIYVQITVLEDARFAEKLLDCVKTAVPEYVEMNMAVPSGYVGTDCDRVSSNEEIHQITKYKSIMKYIIK